ncbi:translational activator for mitochondrial COX1 [Tulasnella sp. 418]|nr:translational activator for mitochondrial COX1 [Tulasnella sp. 418]
MIVKVENTFKATGSDRCMATPLLRATLIRNVRLAASAAARASPRPTRPSVSALRQHIPSKQLFTWTKKERTEKPQEEAHLLCPTMSESPHPDIRARAQRVAAIAPCPVCLDPHSQRRHVAFECPDCGWPTHCSELHWSEDPEHAKYCSRLREVNEDEHDIRSGRDVPELNFPGMQAYDEAVSFSNWDIFWFTRGFKSINTERSRRLASKMLTYPITIASVLHEHSGLTHRNQRITPEGLRSLTALRSSLHTAGNVELTSLEKAEKKPIRIFILGARSESNLPPDIWNQIGYLFPSCVVQIYLIGPQVSLPRNAKRPPPDVDMDGNGQASHVHEPQPVLPLNSSVKRTTDLLHVYGVPSYTTSAGMNVSIYGLEAYYHQVHAQFAPFDPYTDVFFAFSPGFGFPSATSPPLTQMASPTEWGQDIPMILDTKCPLFVTGFSPTDVERDVRSLDGVEGVSGEFDWILTPGINPFGSEKWEVAEFDPRVMVKTNWGVWGIRGKRRDIRQGGKGKEEEEDEDDFEGRYVKT